MLHLHNVVVVAVLLDPRAPAFTRSQEAKRWSPETVQALILEGKAGTTAEAVAMLGRSQVLSPQDADDVVFSWVNGYRRHVEDRMMEQEAAEAADEELDLPLQSEGVGSE